MLSVDIGGKKPNQQQNGQNIFKGALLPCHNMQLEEDLLVLEKIFCSNYCTKQILCTKFTI